MKRFLAFGLFAALLSTGCGGNEERPEVKSTLPQADQRFDKSKAPGLKAGSVNKKEKVIGE